MQNVEPSFTVMILSIYETCDNENQRDCAYFDTASHIFLLKLIVSCLFY